MDENGPVHDQFWDLEENQRTFNERGRGSAKSSAAAAMITSHLSNNLSFD